MKYPIEYKQIPVQFAFYIHEDGKLQIEMLHPVHKEMQFENEVEAREYVSNLKEII